MENQLTYGLITTYLFTIFVKVVRVKNASELCQRYILYHSDPVPHSQGGKDIPRVISVRQATLGLLLLALKDPILHNITYPTEEDQGRPLTEN